MRVGLLTQWFDPEPGPASLPGVLARGLQQRGHDVHVLTGFPNYPTGKIDGTYRQTRRMDETIEGVKIRRVALYPAHGSSTGRRLLNYSSFAASAMVSGLDVFKDLDALWVNYSPVTIGVPMFVQRWRRRTPTVVHVLDLWPDTLFASGFGGEGKISRTVGRMLNPWCTAMYDAAESVAYISRGVGSILAARGVSETKLEYVPMWADEATFRPQPDLALRGWDLGPEHVVLVYAGTLGGAQGLTTLIDACALVEDPNFLCLIAGSGVQESSLRERVRERQITNIRFVGRVGKTEIATLMAASDMHYVGLNDHPLAAVTMPSKLQTALASARPIIGSLMGDAAATIRESGAGWTARPEDPEALAQIIRAACVMGRVKLRNVGVIGRRYYERELSVDEGVSRVETLLTRAATRESP